MKALAIDDGVMAELLAHCRKAYPHEACGLLSGKKSWAYRHFPIPNVALDPLVEYEMDPQGQYDAFRAIEGQGEDLVAIYHSHPTTPAVPSRADISRAYYPRAYYLIVSLAQNQPEVRAYRLNALNGRAVEVYWHLRKWSPFREDDRWTHK